MENFINQLRESEKDNGRLGATFTNLGPVTTLSEDGGFGRIRAMVRQTPNYQRGLSEAQRLLDRVLAGSRRAMLHLQEALTTSDFSTYFGDVLDRSVLSNYAETPYTWDLYCKRATIRDFRQAKIFRFDRGAAVLDGPINPSANADVNAKQKNGDTPLHNDVRGFDLRAIEYLIENGADVNAVGENGKTPLHIAIQVCSPLMIVFLVEKGRADIFSRNKDGKMPNQLAKWKEISTYLEERVREQTLGAAREALVKLPCDIFMYVAAFLYQVQ